MKNESRPVLVDTSAWIASFRAEGDPQLQEILKQKIAAGLAATAPVIILELVQGCRTIKERELLRGQLESLENFHLDAPVWERAYSLAFDLRKEGLTIPTVDVMIIAIALENDCDLLQYDKHFSLAARHVQGLRLLP